MTHPAPQHGFDSYTGYEVEPDDMQHLEDQQQDVEEPPGRVRPDYGPALKHSGVQDPEKTQETNRCELYFNHIINQHSSNEAHYNRTQCNSHLVAKGNQAGE